MPNPWRFLPELKKTKGANAPCLIRVWTTASMGRDIPSHASCGNHEDDKCGNDHGGFLSFHDSKSSIGQIANKVATSQALNGLWPVNPTTPPMNAEAAMVSMKRASPSFCSLLYFDGMGMRLVKGEAPGPQNHSRRRQGSHPPFGSRCSALPAQAGSAPGPKRQNVSAPRKSDKKRHFKARAICQ